MTGRLPLNANQGYWWWDIAYSTTDYILATGGDRHTFYCPSDKSKNGDMAIVWQYSNDPPYGARIEEVFERRDRSRRTLSGHQLLLDDGHQRAADRTDKPLGVPNSWKWPKNLNVKNAGGTELVLDATLSTGPDPETASFTEVRRRAVGPA